MRLSRPFLVISLLLCASGGLGTKKGYRHLKKFVRKKSLTKIRKEGLQENAAKYLSGINLRGELNNTRRTSSGRRFIVEKNVTLKKHVKRPVKNHRTTNDLINVINKLHSQDPLECITNARVPKESWIKHLTGEPNGDFDEIVTDEGVDSHNTKQDDTLLKRLMKNENDLVLDKPVKEESNVDKSEDDAEIKGRTANGNKSDEEHSTSKQVSKFNDKHHKAQDGDDEGKEDNYKEQNKEEEEDDRNPAQVINDEEEQLLQLMNKDVHDKNQKMEPVDAPDQMNQALQALRPNFQENQEQFNPLINQQRQLEAAKELQTKQEMLQRLQLLNVGNTMLQNTRTPQYFRQQLWPYTDAPVRAPLTSRPTPPNYQPAYVASSPSASPLAQATNQGYSIDVDGVKGIYSKTPGFALRFQSPDSEVTIIKKKYKVVVPPRSGY